MMSAAQAGQGLSGASTICHAFEIAAPPETVFSALTTAEGLSRWWTTSVSGEAAKVGGMIRFTFRGPFNPVLRVTRFDPPARVEWHGAGGHAAWGSRTGIEFGLHAAGSGTMVHFRHLLGPEADSETSASANFNWGYYLDSLRMFCETGNGKPYQVGDPRARVGATSTT